MVTRIIEKRHILRLPPVDERLPPVEIRLSPVEMHLPSAIPICEYCGSDNIVPKDDEDKGVCVDCGYEYPFDLRVSETERIIMRKKWMSKRV